VLSDSGKTYTPYPGHGMKYRLRSKVLAKIENPLCGVMFLLLNSSKSVDKQE
jgi:hypothetical protein